MTLSKRTTIVVLTLTALFFAFTLVHASWLADVPKGKPKLIADRGMPLITDAQGCLVRANSGYGGMRFGPDVESLQLAAGSGADAIVVRTGREDMGVIVWPDFKAKCPADERDDFDSPALAAKALSKPELIWRASGGDVANEIVQMLSGTVPGALDRSLFILPESDLPAFAKTNPKLRAFSVSSARRCAADYRASLLGSVPTSCANGVMLLTLDELGFTLWGWPNRFLERMAKANTMVIIAQSVDGDTIKGLTDPSQYGEIANSFNGYVWVDKIEELGPALKR